MAEPLLWNFKCIRLNGVPAPSFKQCEKEGVKWESRFFWPDDEWIELRGIDAALFDMKNYKHKQKEDYYFLLPKTNENIKLRRNCLLYKPLIQQTPLAMGFGPKIDLAEVTDYPTAMDPKSLQKLKHKTQQEAKKIQVKKESYTYTFPTKPHIKLELAKLEVQDRFYFSLCVEGKSLTLVVQISQALLGKTTTSDYVRFLKKIASW